MERKTISTCCRSRARWGLALALCALFGLLATGAEAMLLTLDLRWETTSATDLKNDYHLQAGSIIQVIGYKRKTDQDLPSNTAELQFVQYGTTTTPAPAAPFDDPAHNVPIPETGDAPVYLANTTQDRHEILYTGAVQAYSNNYFRLYTQFTVDYPYYDTVYIRVFGATNIGEGAVTASYWAISDAQFLSPSYATDTLSVTNLAATNHADYFEVIPEPATLGLLGLGGVALAAWRRRRFARTSGDGPEREED